VACYLCAYKSGKTPESPQPLPDGSAAAPTDELGACARCGVFACSIHSSRPSLFKCAICLPAEVVTRALAPPALGGAIGLRPDSGPISQAELIGQWAGGGPASPLNVRLRNALQRIQQDQQAAVGSGWVSRFSGEPNLVINFPDFVGRDVFQIRAFSGPAAPTLDVLSIGDAIRDGFAVPNTRDLEESEVTAVLGAMAMAYDVADEESRLPTPDQSSWRLDTPPWAITHPVLLDPSIWLVVAAYYLQ
jgi:hypothetical protein